MTPADQPARRANAPKKELGDKVRSLRLSGRPGAAPAGPSSGVRMLPWAVCCVLLLTTFAFAYRAYRVGGPIGGGGEARDEQKAAKDDKPAATTNTTAQTGDVALTATGYVIPVSSVQVSPKVGGQLVWIHPEFKEGRIFKEGQVLARIEQVEYLADRDQTHATWLSAKAKLADVEKTMPLELMSAEIEVRESSANIVRYTGEVARAKQTIGSGAVTVNEYQQLVNNLDVNRVREEKYKKAAEIIKERMPLRIQVARADEALAKAAYDRALARYDWTEIKAPVSGTVLTKKAEKGNIVNPSAFSSGISASLCDMADLRELEVDLSIQERDISAVREGQKCFVLPKAYDEDKDFRKAYPKGIEGTVSRLMPTADRAKGAIPVRVKINFVPESEVGKWLRPDMAALVQFLREPEKKAETPAGSIQR